MTTSGLTSWTLIERAAAGFPADRDAFARMYAPVLRSFFSARWKLPFDHGEVHDATQEVFVQCFKERGVLDRIDRGSLEHGFRAYLYGVARKVAADVERRVLHNRETAAHSAIRADAIERSEAHLSQVFDREWIQLLSRQAGRLMTKRAKTPRAESAVRALRLRFHEDVKPGAIAKELRLDVKVVYELLREAKRSYDAAFLEVMASYHPESSEADLRRRCVELLELL